MDPSSTNRAVMSAGLWFGVVYGIGLLTGAGGMDLVATGKDAAIMGASAYASDAAHAAMGAVPSAMSSALSTGVMYAAIQKFYAGDDLYVVNILGAAGNDYLVEVVSSSMA